jgi:aryl-alcohol dehydrogenase-like predicted oxidoreductase
MEYRRLGRTGLEASAIGLGTEYLNGQPREVVIAQGATSAYRRNAPSAASRTRAINSRGSSTSAAAP